MGRLEPMKTTLTIACGASLFLLSFVLPGDQVRFAVKEGTKLSKVFDDKSVMHSTSISATFDGEDAGEGMSDVKLTLEDASHVEVTDEYGALKNGKPAKLTRTYDKLGGTTAQKLQLPEGMEDHASPNAEKERSSELEGKTVVFKLSDDGEDYKADFADGKGDADLLKKLEEDMDLRGFLPRGEVAEDKSWAIEGKVFNGVLGTPGGDLKLKAKDDEEDHSDVDQQLEDNVKGKGKGTYKGKRDVDGHHCAVIALEAELKTQATDDKSGKGAHEGLNEISLEFTVEGELLWDVDEGHFRKCTLTSKVKMTWKETVSIADESAKHELVRTFEFEGEGEWTAALGG
jgi:hypothetical protein